jgi:hypothetical protein
MFGWFGLCRTEERVREKGVDKIENTQCDRSFVFDSEVEVLKKLGLDTAARLGPRFAKYFFSQEACIAWCRCFGFGSL